MKPFSIHPTILNLTLVTPPSITNIAKGAVDIIVPSSQPLTAREWDLLEEAVNAIDGSWDAPENQQGGGKIVICESPSGPRLAHLYTDVDSIIAGILPPPLTTPASSLAKDDLYNLHLERVAQLSLHPNVYLKVLPPVVESVIETWYNDHKELDRVIKMYRESGFGEAFVAHEIRGN